MAYSVISNTTFDSLLASEYATASYVEHLKLFGQAMGRVLHLACAGESAESMDGGGFHNPDKGETGLVLRRRAGPVRFTEDLFIRGLRRESVEREIGRQIGCMAAKEVRERLIEVACTALESLDDLESSWGKERTNNVHEENGEEGQLNSTNLANTLKVFGDECHRMTTVVCHFKTFNDLVKDTIGDYKSENVGGFTIITELPAALGMRVVIVDDPSLEVVNLNERTKYRTLLFGQNALGLIYHQNLRIEAERLLDYEMSYWKVLANFDFTPHLFGMKWVSGRGKPDNKALGTVSNWDVTAEKHDEVLCAMLVHDVSESR